MGRRRRKGEREQYPLHVVGIQRDEVIHSLQLALEDDGLLYLRIHVLHHLVGVVVLRVLLQCLMRGGRKGEDNRG